MEVSALLKGVIKMSQVHLEDAWLDVGGGILLRYHNERGKKYTVIRDFLEELREYDMLEINLLHPDNRPVAVDIGSKPRIIQQKGQSNAVLLGQIATLQHFPTMLQMLCHCFDEINNKYYIAELGINLDAPHEASLKLSACLPVKNFGAPPPDMKAAFAAYFAKMHPGKTPPI